jgi:hypothetical protein
MEYPKVAQTCLVICRIADRERQLSILYQKQGRRTQFNDKASRDQWLQNQIDDTKQGILDIREQVSMQSCGSIVEKSVFYVFFWAHCGIEL